MGTCLVYNCTALLKSPPASIEPNPDVSGIGVLVGFLATAYLALCLVIVHYVLVFNPAEAGPTEETRHVNPIDVIVLKFVGKWVERPQKTWEGAIEKMVLMMSDQQMITGIALLFSAVTQLRCGISPYHWQTMIYLVWLSSFTHLATLTILRRYFYKNPAMRLWRLFFMTILISLLIAALIPTGNSNWLPIGRPPMPSLPPLNIENVPALCLFRYPATKIHSTSFSSMMFSVLVLCVSYTTRAIKLFERSSKFVRLNLRTKPGNTIKRHLHTLYVGHQNTGTRGWILSIPYYVILSALLVIRSWLDLFNSMLWEITWLLIALLWDTLRLFSLRSISTTLDENFWGFGQCLGMAMVVLLLFSAVETYIETKRKVRETTSMSRTINGDDNIVDENRSSQPLRHSTRESSQMTVNDISGTKGLTEADISDQAPIAIGTDEFPWRLPRPATTIGVEERSLGTSIHQRPRSFQDEEEHADTRHADKSIAEDALEQPSLPAYERDYYVDRWYISLAAFNFVQTMLLSMAFLGAAYTAHNYVPTLWILDVEDVLGIFMAEVNWIFVYAPFSSFAIALSNLWFYTTQRRFEEKLPWWARCITVNRLRVILEAVLLCCAATFSVMTSLGYSFFWEPNGIAGQLIIVFVIALLTVICVPWSWVISRKLKRESRA